MSSTLIVRISIVDHAVEIPALFLFGIWFPLALKRPASTFLLPAAAGIAAGASTVYTFFNRVGALLAFDLGISFGVAFFVLTRFAQCFSHEPAHDNRCGCALLGAALAIDPVFHIGIGMLAPSPPANAAILAVVVALIGLWLWNMRITTIEDA